MQTLPQIETELQRVILFASHGAKLLVLSERGQFQLPAIHIPRHQRVAEHLTTSVRRNWSQDAVSLFSLDASPIEFEVSYQVMESTEEKRSLPNFRWVSVSCLGDSTFGEPGDVTAVKRALAQIKEYATGLKTGPFGRTGWFAELTEWVREQIRPMGWSLNGRFQQFNASPTFSLIRFETNGAAVWFKAVGTPNLREHEVTLALARLFSRFLPRIIATRPECNGWLAQEVEGSLLHESSVLVSWEAVASDLAELQINSLGSSLHVLDAGARDLRPKALEDLVEPFFQAMCKLMERQPKVPPAALSCEELRYLSARVHDALAVLNETGVPTTLGHLDINPGNIVCSPTGYVFLDWAAAFVGHPFFTFQYLLEHFRRAFGQDRSQEQRLVARYTCPWRALISESDIHRALDISPLMAVFACAVGNDLWMDSRKLEERRAGGYLRGLTRRMDLEARTFGERSVPCRSSC